MTYVMIPNLTCQGAIIEMFEILWLNMFFCSFARIAALDMPTAVQNLREPDHDLQVLGAAYIQHECYNDSEAKDEVAHADLLWVVLLCNPLLRSSVMKIVFL